MLDTKNIQSRLRAFAEDLDCDQFHSPKNLSMALADEIGELLEIFQWLTESASQRESLNDETLQAISEELAESRFLP